MIELGQPIHGYDLDKLQGGITVRRAAPGEKLETLDGKVRALHVEDLLITDESGPIGLAGVMGGGTTEMGPDTRNVLIEAATFDTVSIARTARRHKLPSEASRRFERGVDPLVPFVAARRVADLMVEHAGGTLDTKVGGALFAPVETRAITLPAAFTSGLIGVDYTAGEIVAALEKIGCRVDEASSAAEPAEAWYVTPAVVAPRPHRQVDARRRGRPHRGLRPHPVGPADAAFGPRPDAAQQGRRRVANALAAAGYTETPSFGFTTEDQNDLHGSASGDAPPVGRAREPARRPGAVPAPLAGPGAPPGGAPQPLARTHRRRALRDRQRVPARAGRRVRHVVRSRRSACARMPRPSPSSTPRSRRSTATSRCS